MFGIKIAFYIKRSSENEEAVRVGGRTIKVGIFSRVILKLNKDYYMIATHRGHGQELMKGTSVDRMMAEMIGKETGICKGRVGSMHVTDKSVNNLGAQGII